ncbi:MAG: hypothetical protein U0326_11315 [Polyangiales bacterium]
MTDHGPTLLDLALAGVGVTPVLDYMADEHLRAGRLVSVLDEARAGGPTSARCAPRGSARRSG